MQMQNQILTILNKIQKDLADVKRKLEDLEPVYGSDAWWKWSDVEALKEIRQGKGTVIRNRKELDKFFKSI